MESLAGYDRAERGIYANQGSRITSTSHFWIDGMDSDMKFTRGNVFWILDEDTGIGEKKGFK